MKTFPKQFLLNQTTRVFPVVNEKLERLDGRIFTNPKIYVTENSYFKVRFENIFDNDYYIINFTTKKDDDNYNANYMKFWQCQLNLAVCCATVFSGISRYHFMNKNLPELVKSVIRFHIYFTIRKILSFMECPLPGDSAFLKNSNHINLSKLDTIKRLYNVPKSYDFRLWLGMSYRHKFICIIRKQKMVGVILYHIVR